MRTAFQYWLLWQSLLASAIGLILLVLIRMNLRVTRMQGDLVLVRELLLAWVSVWPDPSVKAALDKVVARLVIR